MKRTVQQAVTNRPVKDDHFEEWSKKEVQPALRDLYDFANFRYTALTTTITAATGAMTTVWSDDIPDNSSWTLEVSVVARSKAGGAARGTWRLLGLFYREGGGAVQQGATSVLVANSSIGGFNTTLGVSGNKVLAQVVDDAVRTVVWQAIVWVQEVTR